METCTQPSRPGVRARRRIGSDTWTYLGTEVTSSVLSDGTDRADGLDGALGGRDGDVRCCGWEGGGDGDGDGVVGCFAWLFCWGPGIWNGLDGWIGG